MTASVSQTKSFFKMFSSEGYGGGTVLFSENSTTFNSVESDEPEQWMGSHYYNAMRAMDCNPEGEARSHQMNL